MLTLRSAADRGRTRLDWLDSFHSFSFGQYHDPAHTSFGALRVINDDRIAPGGGFGEHPHRDMEILTVVLDGALEHRDSIHPGKGGVIRPGDVQVMSAGTGIRHSEFNASRDEPVHLLQVWMLPRTGGIAPRYEQKHFDDAVFAGRLGLIGSPDGRDGSVTIHQEIDLYAADLRDGQRVTFDVAPDRRAWLQVATGEATLNDDQTLVQGDGVAVTGPEALAIAAPRAARVLLFDMA